VDDEQIEVAVIVVVEVFGAPAAHQQRCAAQARSAGQVRKSQVMVIPVDGIHFLIDVGDKKVLPAILVQVRGIHSHPPALTTVLAERHAGVETNFRKFSGLTVEVEVVLHGVVGDEQIHPAVVVNIGGDRSPSLAQELADAGLFCNIFKCSVAIVVKQPASSRRIAARAAVVTLAGPLVSAEHVFRFVKIGETPNEKIELAIVVVVKPYSTGGPTRRSDAGFLSHVSKSAVAVVAI